MVILVAIALAVVLLRESPVAEHVSREGILTLSERIEGYPAAPFLLVAAFGFSMIFGLPATPFILSGGAVFGIREGVFLSFLGANTGANLAFLVSRYVGRSKLETLIQPGSGGTLSRLDALIRSKGWRGLFLLRVFPVIPFNVVNYGSGLSALRWREFAIVTAVGFVPVIVVYTLLADALLDGAQGALREAALQLLVAGTLMALLAFLPIFLGWTGKGDNEENIDPLLASDSDGPRPVPPNSTNDST